MLGAPLRFANPSVLDFAREVPDRAEAERTRNLERPGCFGP
jgi:hypothetical protein